ncbi:MAG: hypothetical protein ACE5HT_03175 [Gemmatimonadales bacterium]
MSQLEIPWWARGSATAFLLLASWWLLNNDSLHGIVGDSIATLGLGVVTMFIILGMHLPLGLWPSDGPWRDNFSIPAVLIVAAAFSITILASAGGSDVLISQVDLGRGILVVGGVVGWGFAVAFVHQRPFVRWYTAATALALLPLIVSLLLDTAIGDPGSAHVCLLTTGGAAVTGAESAGCAAAAVPSLIFLSAITIASKLVAEEIAFRRLLVGEPHGAGLLPVLIGTVGATAWYGLLVSSGIGDSGLVLLGFVGALTASCLYVLSRSLLVSALYSGVLSAGVLTSQLARQLTDTQTLPRAPGPGMWVTTLVTGIVMSVLVLRRNGLVRSPFAEEPDASSS